MTFPAALVWRLFTQVIFKKSFFTDSGAGTLIRRGDKIQKVTLINEFDDIEKLKATLISNYKGLDAEAMVNRFIYTLKEKKFTAYYDDAMQCLAIIIPKGKSQEIAILAVLTTTKSGWLSNVMENIFTAVKKDYPMLVWTVSEEDENLTWFFEKADGSFLKNGNVLFYYGCDFRSEALVPIYEDFISNGRAMLGGANLETLLH